MISVRAHEGDRQSRLRQVTQQLLVVVLAGGAAGVAISRLPAFPFSRLLLIGPIGLAAYLFAVDSRWAMTGVLASTIFGLYRSSTTFGPVDLRILDFPYLFLVGSVVVGWARDGRRRADVGQPYLAFFVVVLGLTVFPLAVRGAGVTDLLVSWVRLAQTASLVWFVPHVIRRVEDRFLMLRVIGFLCVAELTWSIVNGVARNGIAERLAGSNGPNAEGLLAALLIILALHTPVARSLLVRTAYIVVGVTALGMSKSIGSIAALGLACGIFGLTTSRSGVRRSNALLTPARVLFLFLGVVGLVAVLRPSNLPSSDEFQASSTTHRLILGWAGIEIFKSNPIFGVGWQRSGARELIGNPQIAERLRERFSGGRDVFFPDVNAGSVHSLYVQVLAEAGLIGFGVLVVAILAVRRRIKRVLAAARGPDFGASRVCMIAMVVLLVWWNDNPLYGLQPETVLFAVFLGLLAVPIGDPDPVASPDSDLEQVEPDRSEPPARIPMGAWS